MKQKSLQDPISPHDLLMKHDDFFNQIMISEKRSG